MTTSAPLTRRTLLGAAAVAGSATAVSSATAGPAIAATSAADVAFGPEDLDFEVVLRRRHLDLVAPGFRGLADDFGRRRSYEVLARPGATAGRTRWRGGELGLRGPAGGGAHDTLLVSDSSTVAAYSAVTVDVTAFSGDEGRSRVQAGLVRDAGDHLLAWYDDATSRVGIDLTGDGGTETLAEADADLAGPVRFTFALTAGTVVAFADAYTSADPGPQVLVRAVLPEGAPDFRRREVVRAYRHAFGAASDGGETLLERVDGGYFGQLGLRDPHLVTRADGSPYTEDGKVFLTFTQAGLGFFETAHWGVWSLDVRTLELEHTAQLFVRRDSDTLGPDRVLGDHAGHLVLDEDGDRWIVATSTWGDFSGDRVDVGHTTVPARRDLLRGTHVLRTEVLDLPTADLPSPSVGRWDPHVVRIGGTGGRWYVGFVNARVFFDFYPALARSPRGGDYTDLALVGADADKNATEGIVLQRVGGAWHVMASNGDDSPEAIRGQYPVYDLTMTQTGVLDAPHPTNIPWPMVIPVPAPRQRTRWLLVTFDSTQVDEPALGYGTHGDLVVMRAAPTPGREF